MTIRVESPMCCASKLGHMETVKTRGLLGKIKLAVPVSGGDEVDDRAHVDEGEYEGSLRRQVAAIHSRIISSYLKSVLFANVSTIVDFENRRQPACHSNELG